MVKLFCKKWNGRMGGDWLRIGCAALGLALAAPLYWAQGQSVAPQTTQPSQPAQAAQRPADQIPAAREKLRVAEAAHPGNTQEVVDAINELVTLERDAGAVDAATLELQKRVVEMDTVLAGPRSKAVVDALVAEADLLEALDKAPEARAVAEQAVEIAQAEFPRAEEMADAAGALGRVCSWMGDFKCALRAFDIGVDLARDVKDDNSQSLIAELSNRGTMRQRSGDNDGAIKDETEALGLMRKLYPEELHYGVIEANLGTAYLKKQDFAQAAEHTEKAMEALSQLYGPDSPRIMQMHSRLGDMETRMGRFDAAWKDYEYALQMKQGQMDARAGFHAGYAISLAAGGNAQRAIEEGLTAERMSREIFVLQARTMPERQALAYGAVRPHGLEVPLSVLVAHPELRTDAAYEEVVHSRALVADEMARRVRNLNQSNDAETARLLGELNKARSDLLKVEQATAGKNSNSDAVAEATTRMEKVERELAERSAAVKDDARASQAGLEDLRRALPANSVLISYVLFNRRTVGKVDAASSATPWYMAFVMRAGDAQIRAIDLGDAKTTDGLVSRLRASVDSESHAGGLGAVRSERAYREAGTELRKRIWDPLQQALAGAKLAIVVPDGSLNLVSLAGLPAGSKGYLVESGPVIHTLSSERDLIPATATAGKKGILAVGAPQFDLAQASGTGSALREAEIPCSELEQAKFDPLPGTETEVSGIHASWQRWNGAEPFAALTGSGATRERFLAGASASRILHIATHAYVLGSGCGEGNPLLHSGLVFAGANKSRSSSILTAQQIASMDLSGVDLAVLSACNTGTGELADGEGVVGLERAFRIAGARMVVMTLWPVDDRTTSGYMRTLYGEMLGQHAAVADAVWMAERKMLSERRAKGERTHPWYWAGFVAAGAE